MIHLNLQYLCQSDIYVKLNIFYQYMCMCNFVIMRSVGGFGPDGLTGMVLRG